MGRKILFIVAFCQLVILASAQTNIPNLSGLPSGSLTGAVSTPLNFNSTPNQAPTTFNYTRRYTPLKPLQTIPTFDNTTGQPILVNTTYYDGYWKPLMNVTRTNKPTDLVTPYYTRNDRLTVDYLPYEVSSHSRFQNGAFTGQSSYYATHYAAEGNTAYSKSESYSNLGLPTTKTYAAGAAFAGQERGITTTSKFNVSNEVYEVVFSSGSIQKTGFYQPGMLTVKTSESPNGQKTKMYYDKSDMLICKKEYGGIGQGNNSWLETYYVYNQLGKLICIVPPKASIQFQTVSSISNADKLCFFYEYDTYGRVMSKTVPGKSDSDLVIYDKKQRIVFSQTPLLKASNKFTFNIYDRMDRVVISGIYDNSSANYSVAFIRTAVLDGSVTTGILDYVSEDFTGSSYPGSITSCDIQLYNYYDAYTNLPVTKTYYTGFTNDYLNGPEMTTPEPYYFTYGKLVGSKVKILDNGYSNNFSTGWLTSIQFYDEMGRVIQTQTETPWNTTIWDVQSTQYNFSGQPVLTIGTHNSWTGTNKATTTIQVWNIYNANTGELEETKQKIDQETWKTVSKNYYGGRGQLTKQRLGVIENRDYEYNIRGQLKAINAFQYSSGLPQHNVTFGEKIYYESGFDLRRFDGKITGFEWKTSGSNFNAYGYHYDSLGRLIAADFRELGVGNSWTNSSRDFSVSDITYDLNGNMKTMEQHGYNTSMAPAIIDDFTYTYDAGNRLTSLKDDGVNSPIEDFDNTNGNTTTYTYDADGNMTGDALKQITLTYNHLGQPLQVYNSDTHGEINNIYDAVGRLIQKTVYDSDTQVYVYWGPYVYRNDSLLYIMHGQGRAKWIADSNYFKYDYFVKDHLGNVRTVVTSDAFSLSSHYLATHEVASANLEESIFENLGDVNDTKPDGTPGDVLCERLTSSEEERRVGAAILLHVMAGDKISASVYGYHDGKIEDDNHIDPEVMANTLISTLAGGNGGFEGGEEENGISTIQNLLTEDNYGLYDEIKNSNTIPENPRGYLSYVVFDEEFKLNEDKSGVIQTSGIEKSWQLLTTPSDLEIEENGYILIFLSNEEEMDVYFDNLKIIHHNGRLLEEQHYYPHGLLIQKSLSSIATPENIHQFQGNKIQKEIGMMLYDFNARQYDQQTGRFTAIDPMADQQGQESLSPFQFCNNDPANYIDPMGLFGVMSIWNEALGAWYGGAFDEVVVTAKGAKNQEGSAFVDYLDLYNAMGTGRSGGGASGGGAVPGLTKTAPGGAKTKGPYRPGSSSSNPAIPKTKAKAEPPNRTEEFAQRQQQSNLEKIQPKGMEPIDVATTIVDVSALAAEMNQASIEVFVGRSDEMISAAMGKAGLKYIKGLKAVGNGANLLGAGATIIDGMQNGFQTHHIADLGVQAVIYGVSAAVPGVGWAIGGAYFLGNLYFQSQHSGMSITEYYLDNKK